jgi:hypothetical protein
MEENLLAAINIMDSPPMNTFRPRELTTASDLLRQFGVHGSGSGSGSGSSSSGQCDASFMYVTVHSLLFLLDC